MGIPILIMGKSGTGKSTSLRNFEENEIGLINVSRKPLPFRKKFKKIDTDDYNKIISVLQNSEVNTIIIDDAGYLIVNQFMKGHSNAGSGNAIFGFYNKIGDSFFNLVEICKTLPENKLVYFLMHEDKNEFGDIKPKTIGKILDEKVCLEGLFTIVLRSVIENKKYLFKTQSDGYDVAKTPLEMFDNALIDNDLKIVDTKIREYWNI